MSTTSPSSSTPTTVNQWSRLLGVSLRPWSGEAPHWLILRGVIQAVLCAIVARFAWGLWSEPFPDAGEAAGLLKNFALFMFVALSVIVLLAVARIIVGVLDAVPRRTVTGQVVSLRERKALDVLPRMAQRLIFERNDNNIDRRKRRTEVVLLTDTGERQWTVRKSSVRKQLAVGSTVQLRVSPIVGYVADVSVQGGTQ